MLNLITRIRLVLINIQFKSLLSNYEIIFDNDIYIHTYIYIQRERERERERRIKFNTNRG